MAGRTLTGGDEGKRFCLVGELCRKRQICLPRPSGLSAMMDEDPC